jgi:hypothetical protein
MPIIKERQGKREKMVISAISDLKLAKKEKIFTAESRVLLYEEGDIDRLTNTYNALEDAFFVMPA